ncbi:MAG TPA: hypothetical protein VF980_14670, partial [Thermoanaerobaculia bacterium]
MTDSKTSSLARVHDELLFLCAYPPTPLALRRAESRLRRFAKRMKGVDPFLDPEISGIAGTEVDVIFSYDFVSWLKRRFPRQVDIDWDEPPDPDRLAAVLTPLMPRLAEEVVDADAPYFEVLRARGLPWLLDHVDALAYDSLGLRIVWKFDASHSRTLMRRKPRKIFYRRGPLLARRDVSIERELAAPPMPISRLSRAEGERVLEIARTALAMRYRELYNFTWGDPATIISADAGRGLEIVLIGLTRDRRLPLRAGFAPFVFRNGVPIGYGDAFGLCERMEVSFNIFYGFREGESAFAFARLLKLYRQLFGSTVFTIDPYQIGHGNDEAIDAGAFWFYRKLGFRSTDTKIERMAVREEARIQKEPQHRTSKRMLKTMAQSPMAWGSRDWDRFRIHKVVDVILSREDGEESGRGQSHRPDSSRSAALRMTTRLSPDLRRAKNGRTEQRYLRMLANNKEVRSAL